MFNITKEQAKNLESHANWMEKNVDEEKFDMSQFHKDEDGFTEYKPYGTSECKSSMCAIGWSVLNKELPEVKESENWAACEDWSEYSNRVFGVDENSFEGKLFGARVPNNLKLVTTNMKIVARLSQYKDIDDKILEILLDIENDNKYYKAMKKALAKELGLELYESTA